MLYEVITTVPTKKTFKKIWETTYISKEIIEIVGVCILRTTTTTSSIIREEIMLAPGAKHVSDENIKHISASIAVKYGISERDLEIS